MAARWRSIPTAQTLQSGGASGVTGLYLSTARGLSRLVNFQQGVQAGDGVALSEDGGTIAFSSNDPTLDSRLAGTNARQLFVMSTQPASTPQLLTVTGGTNPGCADSWDPSLSGTGRYVAFASSANNLIAGDTNGYSEIFLYDQQNADTPLTRIANPVGNGDSWEAQMNGNGTFVIFTSNATNIGVDTNHACNVYRCEMDNGNLIRVSIGPGGVQGNDDSDDCAISDDGTLVGFISAATNFTSTSTNGAHELYIGTIPAP